MDEMKPSKIDFLEDEDYIKPHLITTSEDDEIEEEEQAEDKLFEIMSTTPIMGNDIYNRLPKLVKRWLLMFPDDRSKDIFITGMLTSLGAYFSSNTSIIHHGNTIYPCIYTYVSATSGAGKSAVRCANHLLRFEDDGRNSDWMSAMEEFKAREQDKETDAGEEAPKHQAFFLPSDVTTAKMMEYLSESSKRGQGSAIIEEEMDELVGKMAGKHSDFSPIFRKIFDFVRLKKATKGDNQQLIVNCPKVGICMAGTPDQPVSFFMQGNNAVNGLLQRFVAYNFSHKREFKAGFDHDEEAPDLETFFGGFSSPIKEHGQKTVRFNKPTKLQQEKFVKFFKDFEAKHKASVKDIESFTPRMASTCLRIMMTLSRLDEVITTERYRFTDAIFDLTLDIFAVYAEHSMIAYKLMFKGGQKVNIKNVNNLSNEKLLTNYKDYLKGESFKNADFFNWCKGFGMKMSAKDESRLTGVIKRSKLIESVGHGVKKFI